MGFLRHRVTPAARAEAPRTSPLGPFDLRAAQESPHAANTSVAGERSPRRRRRRLIGSGIRSWQLVVKTPKPSSWRHRCLPWCNPPRRWPRWPAARRAADARARTVCWPTATRLEKREQDAERSASSQATRRKPPSSTRRFLACDSLPHPALVEEHLEEARSDFGIHAGRRLATAEGPRNLCHFLNLSPPPWAVTDRARELGESNSKRYTTLEWELQTRGSWSFAHVPLAVSLRA